MQNKHHKAEDKVNKLLKTKVDLEKNWREKNIVKKEKKV